MRELTDEERAVLAHTVIDPDAWWAHVNSKDGHDGKRKLNPKQCLADKCARWKPEYEKQALAEVERLETVADGLQAADEPILSKEEDRRGINDKRQSRITAGKAAALIPVIVYKTRAEREADDV